LQIENFKLKIFNWQFRRFRLSPHAVTPHAVTIRPRLSRNFRAKYSVRSVAAAAAPRYFKHAGQVSMRENASKPASLHPQQAHRMGASEGPELDGAGVKSGFRLTAFGRRFPFATKGDLHHERFRSNPNRS
jgi:hypothetical protein